jgi:putative FmdB family regulatory protein
MPIYEYKCAACDEVFEALVRSMSDSSRQKCPTCGSRKTKKIMSVFAAQGMTPKSSSSRGNGHGSGCASCGGGHCSTCGH